MHVAGFALNTGAATFTVTTIDDSGPGSLRQAVAGANSAGVKSVRKGAHLFRHSLATAMLRRGASLDEIGQVLRHQDPNTTAIYAKVDLDSLRRLAVPWPGGGR